MWRGTTPGVPIRTGASFVGVGSLRHRVVLYPISRPEPSSGLATINWIAEITVDNSKGWSQGDWNRRASLEDFIHHFADWNYGWLDVPAMLSGANEIFEYPMIDRDPVPSWVDGNVALLGDAAHVMYPVGSNGASQAIVDARVLGAAMVAHGPRPRRFGLMTTSCAPTSPRWCCAIEGPARSASSAWWMSVAAASSTTSTAQSCSAADRRRPSWRATRRRQDSPSRRSMQHRRRSRRARGSPEAFARGVLGNQLRESAQAITTGSSCTSSSVVTAWSSGLRPSMGGCSGAHHSPFDCTNSAPSWSHRDRRGLVTSNAVCVMEGILA